jgi:uncharacterized protein
MTADKKRQLALTFLSVLSHPDAETVKSVTVEDFVWSFPGASQISGVVHGVDGVMKRAQTIASYGVKVEVGQVAYGFGGVGVTLHNTGNKDGRALDEHVVAVFAFHGDRLARLDTHLSDVAMADAFFG